MKQGLLAFQYEEEKSTTGMTALSGLMTYVELMHVAGLRSSVERRVGLRGGGQGWTDSQIITSLILLNLAGGESVMDLEVLEKGRRFVQGTSTCRDPWDASQGAQGAEGEMGAESVGGGCRQTRWCSGIWRGSTTQVRRPNVRRTEHSSLPSTTL